ncbi:MAG: hypothetical protein ABR600_02355 [Actinomycetota bacterium]
MKKQALVLAALMIVAGAGQASAAKFAAGTLYPPQFRNQQVYFHCAGTTKVGNVSLAAEDAIPSWNTTAPAGSVTDGDGCGTGDANGVALVIDPQENPTDGVWRGTFTGNLDRLTVTLYNFANIGTARADGASALGVRLNIDGAAVTGDGSDSHDITATDSNSGATQTYTFSVTDLGFAEPNEDVDGDGIGDNPFGTQQHTLTLTVDGYNVDQNALGAWVYDASEIDSGISFNPGALAATVIPRVDQG